MPRLTRIEDLEIVASFEHDGEANFGLTGQRSPRHWLRVAYRAPEVYQYFHDQGRYRKEITRTEAQALMDKEHAR